MVASRRGRAGGYVLIKRPAEITIGQILRAIDGPIAPLPCISRTAYRRCADCADEKTCVVRQLFADTYAATLLLFDGTTLADALTRQGPAARVGGPENNSEPSRLTEKSPSGRTGTHGLLFVVKDDRLCRDNATLSTKEDTS